jgi:hypothetical protein
MFDSTYLLLNLFCLLGVTFALWKGSKAERIAAAVVFANLAIGVVTDVVIPQSAAVVLLVNDGIAAAALLAVTVRYAALWMGGVMLFYAAQFSLHAIYMVTERPRDYLHALVNNVDFIGIVWCLIIGAAMAWRQRVRGARSEQLLQQAAP